MTTTGCLVPAARSGASTARRWVRAGVARALGDVPSGLDAYREPAGDPGLFGPRSVAWQVHADLPSLVVGGVSSLMLQTLHPLAMAGVAGHSRYRDDPFGRLQRTAAFVAGTTFGGRPVVDRLVAHVRATHLAVRGVAPDGRPYSASDPDLLTWVHTAEVWSFLRSYQRYGPRPLLRSEKDRYLAEVAEVARLLGARDVPCSVDDVREYLRSVRPELAATDDAIDAVAFLRRPLGTRPADAAAHRVVAAAAVDLLPTFARRALRLRPGSPLGAAAARSAGLGLALTVRWALGPSLVREAATGRVHAGGEP
ncbi:MAG: oxygenase MpaB family protein [Actinomycetota bacterium]|nr:oxygenase MpaB family protein [Actinomycetota bacterium]